MHEINTVLRFNAWSDWCDFLNGLMRHDIMRFEEFEAREWTLWEQTAEDDVEEYPARVDEVHLNKEALGLGTFFIWLEKSFDRMGPVQMCCVVQVPDNPDTPDNWWTKAERAKDPYERNELGFFTA